VCACGDSCGVVYIDYRLLVVHGLHGTVPGNAVSVWPQGGEGGEGDTSEGAMGEQQRNVTSKKKGVKVVVLAACSPLVWRCCFLLLLPLFSTRVCVRVVYIDYRLLVVHGLHGTVPGNVASVWPQGGEGGEGATSAGAMGERAPARKEAPPSKRAPVMTYPL